MGPDVECGEWLGAEPASVMSFRLEMLQVARLAPQLLGEVAGLVGDFIRAR